MHDRAEIHVVDRTGSSLVTPGTDGKARPKRWICASARGQVAAMVHLGTSADFKKPGGVVDVTTRLMNNNIIIIVFTTTRSNPLEIVLIRDCLYGPDACAVFTLKTAEDFTIERR